MNKFNNINAQLNNIFNQSSFTFTVADYKNSKKIRQQHPFHLVDPSPWPILTSFAIYLCVITFLITFNDIETISLKPLVNTNTFSSLFLMFGGSLWINLAKCRVFLPMLITFLFLSFVLYNWFANIIVESWSEGQHTKIVQQNMQFGFFLFILSEVMFFFGFFWAYFHMCLNPSVAIGCIWPPKGIEALDIWELPLLNTVILLSSGVTVTLAHRAIVSGLRNITTNALLVTISYGFIFSCIQAYEYNNAPFAINDGVYGSLFFLLTGFHGIHVCIGILFLFICFLRNAFTSQFTRRHHVGFVCAAWYWHFVDVVWLFLFIVVYWWGS
jgi:heme/copper-type cytochrome/quinol oxidase subunit 3